MLFYSHGVITLSIKRLDAKSSEISFSWNCNIQGGILEKESPIDVSNLAIYNKKTKKADKINIEIKKDKKIRVFKSDGKEIK